MTKQATPQKKPSTARTVMQQVVSFTRQRNLPPKSREEEVRVPLASSCLWEFSRTSDWVPVLQEKHLQQLAEMHAASREAGQPHFPSKVPF